MPSIDIEHASLQDFYDAADFARRRRRRCRLTQEEVLISFSAAKQQQGAAQLHFCLPPISSIFEDTR